MDDDATALLAQRVEESLRASGNAEVSSQEVGLAVLEPLRALDEVAYLRFASVYRAYDSLDDFDAEIARLRGQRAFRPAAAPRADPVVTASAVPTVS